jgi:glycosyltransferase involved in cell wall biosynthesis
VSRLETGGRASLVVPAFNEAGRIGRSIAEIAAWRRSRPGGWDWEVIVVDDGSTDSTGDLARRAAEEEGLPLTLLRHERNRGKGAAVRTGFRHVEGTIVIIQDADLEYDPAEYARLIQPIVEGVADVVFGSRF